MAIPKEPRQLMINIMYLVLTALLALNVSAEIFNAFKVVDEGLIASNTSLDESNSKLPDIIKERAKKKKELEVYAERVGPAREISKELSVYIDEIVNMMIDEAGVKDGVVDDQDYVEVQGVSELRGKKNKDVTTRLLVDEGKGQELKAKIEEYRAKFLELIDEEDRAAFEKDMALIIDDETWRKSNKKRKRASWEAFNFRQMPLAATLPIFSKFKNDAKSTESAVLNYLMGKVGGEDIVLDKFTVVSAPKKSYVIKGERFDTEVFLSASASAASNTGVSIRVNGAAVRTDENGVAKWSAPAGSVGIKTYTADISVTNPVTGESSNYKRTFEYEVGERSVSVSASKMNVFYIGVDNPVEVSAAGVSSNNLKVSMSGGGGATIKRQGDGTYVVNATKQTRAGEFAKVNVQAPGVTVAKDFRVKRIPDPVPVLSGKKGGAIGNGELRAQKALIPQLEGFDFDARCAIRGFQLIRSAKREDPVLNANKGGKFDARSKDLINMAKPGDIYVFDNIKCNCPGDVAGRTLPSVVFKVQ